MISGNSLPVLRGVWSDDCTHPSVAQEPLCDLRAKAALDRLFSQNSPKTPDQNPEGIAVFTNPMHALTAKRASGK